MINASKKRQLQWWHKDVDDNAFQKAIESNQFSTDELRWLLHRATAPFKCFVTMTQPIIFPNNTRCINNKN